METSASTNELSQRLSVHAIGLISMMRAILCFFLGLLTASSGFFMSRLFDRSHQGEARIWGHYWESRMGLEYALMDGKSFADHSAIQWATENRKWFDELKAHRLLVPVYYNWKDEKESGEFQKTISQFQSYRDGFSLEGGQWPVGIEYIDNISLPYFPKKFTRK
jgi:hypothetical protein